MSFASGPAGSPSMVLTAQAMRSASARNSNAAACARKASVRPFTIAMLPGAGIALGIGGGGSTCGGLDGGSLSSCGPMKRPGIV